MASFPNLTNKVKAFSIKCAATTATPLSQSQDLEERVFNFAAGPATLPEKVLKKAQSELYNWHGSGMSVMEMSHRGKEFLSIIQKAEADLRALLNISEDYAVLFLQGGATTQFAAIPLNLVKPEDSVDYVVTGSWGDKAFKEAQKYSKPKVIWSVFDDLLAQGGLKEVEKKNKKKGDLLYNAIDESKGFYRCPVDKSVRSLMNVPFTLEKSELEAEFIKEAAKEKMIQLKGHRSVGGMRASIYNAMPLAGVEKLWLLQLGIDAVL
ncbi:hypothetical protein NC652_012424 [Populus alba x Populus x berolinensis]|nr:hypothetical protein NC652_012424 [Populus alba x Populus x berolinensis]